MTQTTLSTASLTLVRAAEQLVAERGLYGVRASEVVKAAGHKNNSAIAYHFGSWDGLLAAVWQLHAEPANAARAAFISAARSGGDLPLPTMVEAYVSPLVAELRRHRPSYWARFSEQWLAGIRLDFFAVDDAEAVRQPHTDAVMVAHGLFTDIAGKLTQIPESTRPRRVALMARFVIGALAAWEREPASTDGQELNELEPELIRMAVALLEAP